MELRRFFVDPCDISGDTVTVTGDEFLHMTKVLRMKTGFIAVICANDGVERVCRIKFIGRDSADLTVEETRTADRKNKSLTLYAGLLKNNKLDFTIQKAVELGVDRIVPFVSDNSAETAFNLERARRIALEAAKQCGSAYLSQVCRPIDFDGVVSSFSKHGKVLFAYELEKNTRIKDADLSSRDLGLVIGPEGGFTAAEAARAAGAGALTVTLGRRILRAETAGIVASALVLDAAGELDLAD